MRESLPPHVEPDETRRWLTPAQCARETQIGVETIYKAVRAKRLRAARIGGRREIRILRTWLQEWLESTIEV